MSRGARPFSLVHDAMSEERLQRIEHKLDELNVRLFGERGNNGIYGRIQSLEEARQHGERREKLLWGFVTSSISGLSIWLFGKH